MRTPATAPAVDQPTIRQYVVELLEEIIADWDHAPISGATQLGSLGIESINLVYLLAEVQLEYALGDRLLSALRADEIDIRGLCVDRLTAIVARLLTCDLPEVLS